MPESLRHYYLQQMGVETWVTRHTTKSKNQLHLLATEAAACSRCILHQTRAHTILGRGNPNATLMIIGDAPELDGDSQGLPYVDKVGNLLQKMLNSIGLMDDDVYVTNLTKCSPPGGRDPKTDEIHACSDYLAQQIAAIGPKLILVLGQLAGQSLLNQSLPLHQMRNKIHTYQGKPLLVSHHPAHLLHNPADKKTAFADLIEVKRLISG